MIPASVFASPLPESNTVESPDTTNPTDPSPETQPPSSNEDTNPDDGNDSNTPGTDDSTGGETQKPEPEPTPEPEPEPEPEPKPEPKPLKITGGMYKTRYTYLKWTADDANAKYYIYRSTKKDSGFKKIATVSNKKGSIYFRNNKTKLTLGKTYYYKVKKILNNKTVDTSNTISIKIRVLPVTNAKATVNSSNDVKLTWTKSSYASYYTIYRSTSKDGEYKKITKATKTSYTDKTPSSGKAYYYKIYAHRKGVSAKSKSSEIIAAYTKTSKPKVAVKYTSSKVNLSWGKVTRATSYYIYKENSEGKYKKIAETKELKYVDNDVKADTAYRYKIYGVYKKDSKKIKGFASSVAYIYTGKIDPNKKMIALTFDDGPGPYTDEIVDCLNKNGARATFFVVGNRVNTYKEELAYAFNSGNEIANHTYSHPTLTTLSTSSIKSQISKTDKAVEKITGQKTTIARAPGGATNSTVRKAAGKPFIYWSIDTLDWKHRNSTKTINAVMNNVKDGDIILMHDIHKPTMQAALKLIPKLKKAGYQLVTVSELAKYRGYNLKNGTTYYKFK